MAKCDINVQKSAASSGVEALINRLREEGVSHGRKEAEKIIADARREAESTVNKAEDEAKTIIEKTQEETKRITDSGKEALHVAFRDTVLDLKSRLMHRFSTDVERLVSVQMKDEAFLQRLILEVASRTRQETGMEEEKNVEILLPRDVVGLEDLRRKPEEIKEGTLSHFVLAMANSILREGLTFKASDDISGGIRIKLVEQNIEIDLTDKAVAGLLLEHLQPRFRAQLEGIVK